MGFFTSFAGLDISLNGTGICVIPGDWESKDFSIDSIDTKRITFGQGKLTGKGYAYRLNKITETVCDFVKEHNAKNIAVEDYAYNRHSRSSTVLPEVGGAIKAGIYRRFCVECEKVSASKARKFLMGWTRGKRKTDKESGLVVLSKKEQVESFLKNRNFFHKSWSLDEMDAFVVAYWLFCRNSKLESFFEDAKENELVRMRKRRKK